MALSEAPLMDQLADSPLARSSVDLALAHVILTLILDLAFKFFRSSLVDLVLRPFQTEFHPPTSTGNPPLAAFHFEEPVDIGGVDRDSFVRVYSSEGTGVLPETGVPRSAVRGFLDAKEPLEVEKAVPESGAAS